MSIRLILGPMYAGKSSELIRLIGRYKYAGKNVFLIKYSRDTRYQTNNNKLSTHDEYKVSCNYSAEGELMKDTRLHTMLENIDVIGLDEGQFYPDIAIFAEHYANLGRIVIVSALDSDFQRKAFDTISKLLPKCEEITKLKAVCSCGDDASFTKRLSNETDREIIGGVDKYRAVCRKCYLK